MAKKILVIDDDPGIVKMVKRRLEANGFDVVSAFDGEEGLAKVSEEDPDLVVLDILMPKMDGYTFVRELKKIHKELPVIVLSAKGGMTDLFEAEGIRDYIVKPFNAEELLTRVNALLSGK